MYGFLLGLQLTKECCILSMVNEIEGLTLALAKEENKPIFD